MTLTTFSQGLKNDGFYSLRPPVILYSTLVRSKAWVCMSPGFV